MANALSAPAASELPSSTGAWSRSNVAVYGDLELNDPDGGRTFGSAVRIENFEDFGTTTNGKVSARAGFVRASVSTGFRAPTPPGSRTGSTSRPSSTRRSAIW